MVMMVMMPIMFKHKHGPQKFANQKTDTLVALSLPFFLVIKLPLPATALLLWFFADGLRFHSALQFPLRVLKTIATHLKCQVTPYMLWCTIETVAEGTVLSWRALMGQCDVADI
jgi:hypothetical protein